jgi:HD-GYP domain-containing protein (c-di-GMP phosphodiesterase class II)
VAAAPARVRLAELVATISLGTDLGLGQPTEHVIRQTIIALRLADLLDLDDAGREVVYYAGLLAWVGCHTDAYEQSKWFGDDIAMKRDAMFADFSGVGGARFLARHIGSGQPAVDRLRTGVAFPREGLRWFSDLLHTHWKAADLFAERLGLGDDVRRSLRESYEWWDGRGMAGLAGEEIGLTSRVVYLADVTAAYQRFGGYDAALACARERSGTQFDPALVDLLCAHAPDVLAGLDADSHWAEILESEPGLARVVDDDSLDEALAAMGDFADLKSPYFIGHSREVAELAGTAAAGLGLDDAEARTIRRAGLVHDLGRLGVSNAVWDKPRPLTLTEMERVRMHPYLTERMLASSPALVEVAAVAVLHHERLDGSGYPRGLSGTAIPIAGRVLAAADRYATLTAERPHRAALSPDVAMTMLRDDVRSGRLDGPAVDAVLTAAGHRVRRRGAWPCGLTNREVEVLRLLTLGLTNRRIADRLLVSPKTVGAHVEHIYTKTGATNRATAGLFAMQHGLMSDFEQT